MTRPRRRLDGRSVVIAAASLAAGLLLSPLLTSGAGAAVVVPVAEKTCPCPEVAPAVAAPATVEAVAHEDAAQALGQSIGTPRRGWLHDATQMPEGEGYRLRNPSRAFGTEATVRHLQNAIDEVRRKHKVHRLGVGDLSDEVGGLLSGHFTHQSGRDVDLGFYYRRLPWGHPKRFARATPDNLNFKGTWALIEALADTAEQPDGVAWIVLDYRVQKMLYMFAKRQGVDEATIEKVFQYPHGPGSDVGLLRHFPGHDNHLHVRFKCPPKDAYCRDPVDPGRGPTWNASRVAGLALDGQ